MKIKFLFITMVLVYSGFIRAESTRILKNPQWHYTSLIKLFPEFKTHLGGFSYEISLQELTCASSNRVDQDQNVTVTVDCTAINEDGKILTRSSPELFLGLLNSGIKLDRTSESGTTYIILKNLNCTLIEPQSITPDEIIIPEYSCSYLYKMGGS